MTRVMLTGANGLLGREILRAPWTAEVEVRSFTSTELDITDRFALLGAVTVANPDVIVNAAAYTAVDAAEDDRDKAFAVNQSGVANLADAASGADALLVHLSTDYVFDGTSEHWYTEDDPVSPLGVYGASKAAGERAAAVADRSVTLRTSWIYGALGRNFVATMLRLAAERSALTVVDDQFGCPTAAPDLAAAIGTLIDVTEGGRVAPPLSLYHLAGADDASWHELASAAIEASARTFRGECRPVPTADYPTRAARPANSRLDSVVIADDLGIVLPSWIESLPGVVAELEGSLV